MMHDTRDQLRRFLFLGVAFFSMGGLFSTAAQEAPATATPSPSRIRSGYVPIPDTHPTQHLSYQLSVGVLDKANAGLRLRLRAHNESDAPISFTSCAMISIERVHTDKPPTQRTHFELQWSPQQARWTCHTGATTIEPHNYHLSCRNVDAAGQPLQDIPPGADVLVYDEFIDLGQSSNRYDDYSLYWSVLAHGAVEGCDDVLGQNNALVTTRDADQHAVTTWVGATKSIIYQRIKPPLVNSRLSRVDIDWEFGGPIVFYPIKWPLGNWMTQSSAAEFQAQLVGTFSNIPPQSLFIFTLDEGSEYWVENGDEETLEVTLPYTIKKGTFGTIQFLTSSIEAGRWVNFQGDVFATADSALYQTGDLMHRVATNFVRDINSPEIEDYAITKGSDLTFHVYVAARDGYSTPAAAGLVLEPYPSSVLDPGKPVKALDIAVASETPGGTVIFEDVIDLRDAVDFDPNNLIGTDLILVVADDVGNFTETKRVPLCTFMAC